MLQFVQRTINSRILSLELVDYVKNDRNACLLDPFKDLFLWAVTCNKMEIAKALWEHGENPIAKALIARKIFLKTAEAYTDHSQYDAHIHAKLEENARYFSDKAIQLLEQCSKEKTEDTKQLINKPIPGWGKKTLIELAALSDFQEFICLPRCKDINDQKWRAGIVPMDGEFINLKLSFTVILLFFPWLFFIRYKKDQIHSCNRCKEVHDGSAGPPAQPIQRRSTPLKCLFTKAGDKIKAFFSAPISKFWCNFISYIYFLMFFNFMALNQLDEGPGKLAYVLLCYIIAFTLEEIRQIKDEIGLKFKHKLRRYFKSTWNKLETVSIVIFIGAFTLHFQPIEREEYRSYARFMYSAVLFLCVMKLLQLLSLFRKIGVYVVMLQKMLIDVAYFVLILAVLVIGYAVARFSVLYPKERFGFSSKSTPNLMRKVFLVPIFQLFGESFIDKPEEAEGANNITVFGTPEYNNIEGYGEVVVLWFTFIYMVLTSLLLVNMLIAVFNFTYSVVEKNADEVWHWQNYNLVREYEGKSRFPAPFSILSHLRDLVVYLWKKIKKRKPKPDTSSGNDKTDSKGCSTKHRSLNEYFNEQAELNELIQFERDCLGHHLNELIKQEKAQEEAQRKILKQLTTETNKKQYWRWPAINLSRRKNSITGLDVARPNSQPTSPLTRAFTSPPDLVKPK
ncbi:transient receptor potential cation channel subfamily M member 1-like [Clytia hemisphaerica]